MIKLNIEELLKKNNQSKYLLCQKMNITSRNLNRIIRGETVSISFKYIEEFCYFLNTTPRELFTYIKKDIPSYQYKINNFKKKLEFFYFLVFFILSKTIPHSFPFLIIFIKIIHKNYMIEITSIFIFFND